MALVTVSEVKTYMDIALSNRQMDAAELIINGVQGELEAYLRRPIEVSEFTEMVRVPSDHLGVPQGSFFQNSTAWGTSYYSSSSVPQQSWVEPPRTVYLTNSPVVSVSKVLYTPLRKTMTTTHIQLTSNVATLTVSGLHPVVVGDTIKVSDCTNSVFNGQFVVTARTQSTISYAKTNANIGLTANTSGTVITLGKTMVNGSDYVVRKFGIDFFMGAADDLLTITYTAGLDGVALPVFKLMILRAVSREIQNMHDDVVGIKELNPRDVAPLTTGFLESELMALKKFRRNRIS